MRTAQEMLDYAAHYGLKNRVYYKGIEVFIEIERNLKQNENIIMPFFAFCGGTAKNPNLVGVVITNSTIHYCRQRTSRGVFVTNMQYEYRFCNHAHVTTVTRKNIMLGTIPSVILKIGREEFQIHFDSRPQLREYADNAFVEMQKLFTSAIFIDKVKRK